MSDLNSFDFALSMMKPDMDQAELQRRVAVILDNEWTMIPRPDESLADEVMPHIERVAPEALTLYSPETLRAYTQLAASRFNDGGAPSFVWALLNPGLDAAWLHELPRQLQDRTANVYRGRMRLFESFGMPLLMAMQFNVASALWTLKESDPLFEAFVYSVFPHTGHEQNPLVARNFRRIRRSILDLWSEEGSPSAKEFARLVNRQLLPDGSPRKDEAYVDHIVDLHKKKLDKSIVQFLSLKSVYYQSYSWVYRFAKAQLMIIMGDTYLERLAKTMRILRAIQAAMSLPAEDDLPRKFFEV